jgi:hypothetical protein
MNLAYKKCVKNPSRKISELWDMKVKRVQFLQNFSKVDKKRLSVDKLFACRCLSMITSSIASSEQAKIVMKIC